MDDIYQMLAAELRQGKTAVLAIIAETRGSTPRKAGAKILLTEEGRVIGTIGGGCIEAAVLELCRAVQSTGEPRLAEFDLTDQDAADAGLICGGKLKVWIEHVS